MIIHDRSMAKMQATDSHISYNLWFYKKLRKADILQK